MEGAGVRDATCLRARVISRLEGRARDLGFSLFGVVRPDPSDHMAFYEAWIGRGLHGEMGYLAREDSVARRADLRRTMGDVASVIVVGHEYYHEDEPSAAADPSRAIIARYARGEDYHDVVKRKLVDLQKWIEGELDDDVTGRVYVDTGPILERDLARRAGLGWFGKNTLLINPNGGSYFSIGLLMLDRELPPSEAFAEERCGTCTACLDGCPTGALLGRNEDGAPRIDARRCISYLTIELRDAIPRDLRAPMGNRVFGCDICQEVCPWNQRFATPTGEVAYQQRDGLDGPSLVALTERLLPMSEKAYQREFVDSPLARPRRKGMLRNLCVALGNWMSADPQAADEAVPLLVRALNDAQPLVRRHAAWALGCRGDEAASRAALLARAEVEDDALVREEIDLSLTSTSA